VLVPSPRPVEKFLICACSSCFWNAYVVLIVPEGVDSRLVRLGKTQPGRVGAVIGQGMPPVLFWRRNWVADALPVVNDVGCRSTRVMPPGRHAPLAHLSIAQGAVSW